MKAAGVITGVLMIILGIVALTIPFRVFLGIGWALGVLFLLNGMEMTIQAFEEEKKDVLKSVCGILIGIGGLILLCNGIQRFLTDGFMAYFIGAYVIIYGVRQLFDGVKNKKVEQKIYILKMICGAVSAMIGVLAMIQPAISLFSMGTLVGTAVVLQGCNVILLTLSRE